MNAPQTGLSDMSTNGDSPFFAIPLELRDAIYSYLSTTRDVTDWSKSDHPDRTIPITLYSPEPQTYLICKQFTAELHDHLRRVKSQKLTIQDHLELEEWPFMQPECKRLRWLEMDVSLRSTCDTTHPGSPCRKGHQCAVWQTIEWHQDALHFLCHDLYNLQKLEISISIPWQAKDRNQWPSSRHGKGLTDVIESLPEEFPALTRMQVYKLYESGEDGGKDEHEVWVRWDKSGGWQTP